MADLLDRVREHASSSGRSMPVPSLEVAAAAFETVDHRPEDLLRALEILGSSAVGGEDPDVLMPPIAATLRETAVDVELAKVDRLGALAIAVFARLIEGGTGDGEGERGLFSRPALEAFSDRLGRGITSDEVNVALRALVAENLVMRVGHGRYFTPGPIAVLASSICIAIQRLHDLERSGWSYLVTPIPVVNLLFAFCYGYVPGKPEPDACGEAHEPSNVSRIAGPVAMCLFVLAGGYGFQLFGPGRA